MSNACRLLEIWGSPRDRGIRYGEGAVAEIRRGTSHYINQMGSLGLSEAALGELVEAYLPIIADFDAVDPHRARALGQLLPLC